MTDLLETVIENRMIVQPKHSNSLGTAHAGNLLKWMDEIGGLSAMRFVAETRVTARMDQVNSQRPMQVGDTAIIEAYVCDAGETSVRGPEARENPRIAETGRTPESFAVYVAIDDDRRPSGVPALTLNSETGRARPNRALEDEQRGDLTGQPMRQAGQAHPMSLDVERPAPPTLETGVDAAEYDDADVVGDTDYRRDELQGFLEDGAWTEAFETWATSTDLTAEEFSIATDLDLFAEFDFFWDDFADRVGYHAPGIPEDWKERSYHPRLDSWETVSSINASLTELGQIVSDVLKDDYVDWESEFEAPDDLPDFG